MNRRRFMIGLASIAGSAALVACGDETARSPKPVGSNASGTAVAPSASMAQQSASTPTEQAAVPPNATVVTAAPVVVGGSATYVNHGDDGRDLVALTFHLGGDRGLAVELLDELIAHSVPATFFAIGSWITAHPDITQRAVENGFELANHTANHLDMGGLSADELSVEITQGGEALVPFIGSMGNWFRPSGTEVPSQLILDQTGRAGYPVSVGYDVDSRDYKEPGADVVVANVNGAVRAGAIVSLHFGHRDTIEALPRILEHLDAIGLTPVTVGELLG